MWTLQTGGTDLPLRRGLSTIDRRHAVSEASARELICKQRTAANTSEVLQAP